jgi:hypothetical protein
MHVNACQDGSLWRSFISDEDDLSSISSSSSSSSGGSSRESTLEDDEDGEAWLDAIAKISADENR